MKHLLLSIVVYSYITFLPFNPSSATDGASIAKSEDFDTVACKWRKVIQYQGETYYTQWTHGNCNVGDDGTLYPIR